MRTGLRALMPGLVVPGLVVPGLVVPGLVVLGLVVLGGCARYAAAPLPRHAGLAAGVLALDHAGVAVDRPLGVEQVAALALRNAPDIVSARPQVAVAAAQRRAAGLAPNPVLSGAFLPLLAGMAGSSTPAFSASVAADIRALITLGARRQAARAAARQVSAQLAWLAWQTVGQARTLAVDAIEGARGIDVLGRSVALYEQRVGLGQRAMAAGNATLATVAPDVAAAQTARGALDDAVRMQQQRRHQLAALLGLAPDAVLVLADTARLPAIDPQAVLAALPSLPARRPDLVALQLGYRAEDARLRVAVLSQFPNLVLGVAGGSDNANVRNLGPQVSVDLPLFDRGQGGVAVERATRAQLAAEYAARLNAADGQVRALLGELAVQQAQRARLEGELPGLARAAGDADRALRNGDLDERSAVDFDASLLAKQQQIIATEQAELDSRAALATLIGADLPPLDVSGDGR